MHTGNNLALLQDGNLLRFDIFVSVARRTGQSKNRRGSIGAGPVVDVRQLHAIYGTNLVAADVSDPQPEALSSVAQRFISANGSMWNELVSTEHMRWRWNRVHQLMTDHEFGRRRRYDFIF